MHTAKQEVATLLQYLPEESTLEDIQYHLKDIEMILNIFKGTFFG